MVGATSIWIRNSGAEQVHELSIRVNRDSLQLAEFRGGRMEEVVIAGADDFGATCGGGYQNHVVVGVAYWQVLQGKFGNENSSGCQV